MSPVGIETGAAKKGRIVRVKMTDFVTYDSVECYPGKGLNVVIGPNGSGKSTLLSAIVLGLGGKPSVIGRSPKVEDYIKTGCREAKVEIELEGEKKNSKIKRTIYRDSKSSSWLLNDRAVSLKEVDKFTKSLNIQIDNLCQVLPQDRVQDFAKMNPQELLEKTQKAVGKESMADTHASLKTLQKDQQAVEASLKNERVRLEQEQGHVDRLRGAVETYEKKQAMVQEVEMCTSKLEILKYKDKKDEYSRFKEQKVKAEQNVKVNEVKVEPFKKLIREAEKKCIEVQNKQTGMGHKIRKALENLVEKEDKLDRQRHKILEAEAAKENKLKDAMKQSEEAEKLRLKISRMRTELNSLKQVSKPEQDEKIANFKKDIEELARNIDALQKQKVAIDFRLSQDNQQLRDIKRKQQVLQNVRDTRLRSLESINKPAYRAAMWIEQNRDRFEKNVFLPMCVELNVKDSKFARYVESAVGFNDLVGLVCESKADFSIIVDELRIKQGLAINVLHAEPVPDTFQPRIDITSLKQRCPGFFGYLKDFVTGPPTLISFLCKQKNFHLIPVGNELVNPDQVPSEISMYYTGDCRRSVRKSRYTGNNISECTTIENSRFLASTSDPKELEELNQSASALKVSLDAANNKRDQLNSQINELESNRNDKRKELQTIQTLQSTLKTQTFQIAQKEGDLRRLESNAIDPEKVKEDFTATVKGYVDELCELQEPHHAFLTCVEKCVRDGQVLELAMLAAKDHVKTQKVKCKKEQDALEHAKRTLEEVNNAWADIRTECKRMLTAFERRTGETMEKFGTLNEEVLKTLPSSIRDLEVHIQEKLTLAEMLGVGNDGVIQQYENHVRQVSDLNNTIQRKEAQSERLSNEMATKRNEWRDELNALVNKINENFSNYFRSMGCAGAVELFTGNSEHDYDNYGLRVRVKFRDNEELQDLNPYTQSGGERAVSTAIFMLSLQELTPVPFRLVDEINQGMDSINERRVYELLLNSTSQPDTPQYFLLTPKILKDMPYSETTTVLCIINSVCAPDHRYWDLGKFIELQRGMVGNGHHSADEENDD